ncbi:MAG: hypothetical protein BWY71_00133 [Planctomycetes bacterium ADurb.Bin412]|nr:MAG: hypothetical protein BWY71_00133 [Planctomycetes bacterium ADurb.Bin412]
MTLLSRKKTIRTLQETTKGTAVTSNIEVMAYDVKIGPDSEFIARRPGGSFFGNTAQGVLGLRTGTCAFRSEMRGTGSDTMDLGLANLLLGCGFAVSAQTYTLSSVLATQKCLTLTVWEDGVKKILSGCMGNLKLSGEVGKTMDCNFEFKGNWAAPTDEAMPSVTPNTQLPPILKAGTLTIGGTAVQISKFELDLGNTVEYRQDVNAATGNAHAIITDRDVTVSMDPEAKLVATHDFYGLWLAGTEAALSLVFTSPGADKFTLTLPKLQYKEVQPGDRGGLYIYDINAQANASATGDDELSLVVAAA